jgi:hypothetical protein
VSDSIDVVMEDFAAGNTFDAGQVRAELERRRRGTS